MCVPPIPCDPLLSDLSHFWLEASYGGTCDSITLRGLEVSVEASVALTLQHLIVIGIVPAAQVSS